MSIRVLGLVVLIACFVTAAAAQNRTALYGRVVGSDHGNDVPPGWVVRVTAVREGSNDILDQRDSVQELYCVRVPANSRVRLVFETSFRPAKEPLGYGSARLPEVIDTSIADRKDTYRTQPDVIMSRRRQNNGSNARLITRQELDADIAIARESGNASMVGAKVVTYREAYGSDPLIMADINGAANTIPGYKEFAPLTPKPFEELLKGLHDIEKVNKQPSAEITPQRLFTMMRDASLFSNLRSQAALALLDYYLEAGKTDEKAAAGLAQLRQFFKTQSSSPQLRLTSFIGLAKIGTAEERQEIVKSVTGSDAERAYAAIVAIGEARLQEGVAPLAALLQKDSAPTLQMLATQSLERLAQANIAGAITTLNTTVVNDEQPAVRAAAAESLGGLTETHPEARTVLKEVQKTDTAPEVRAAAKKSLEPKP